MKTSAMFRRTVTMLAFYAAVVTVTSPQVTVQPTTFSDGDFNLTDWDVKEFTKAVPGPLTYARSATGGKPDAYLGVHIHLVRAADLVFDYGVFLKKAATYSPRVSGPILSLHYQEDANSTSGQMRAAPAVMQNGKYYIADFVFTEATSGWHTVNFDFASSPDSKFSELVPGQLQLGKSQPDFTSGDTITFGFCRWDYSIGNQDDDAGIDNWQVRLTTGPAPVSVKVVAVPDVYTAYVGETLQVSAAEGLLHNDVANGPLIASLEPPNATIPGLALQTTGSFSYSPPAGFEGDVRFQYRASSGTAFDIAIATISVVHAIRCDLPDTVVYNFQRPNATHSGALFRVRVWDHLTPVKNAHVTASLTGNPGNAGVTGTLSLEGDTSDGSDSGDVGTATIGFLDAADYDTYHVEAQTTAGIGASCSGNFSIASYVPAPEGNCFKQSLVPGANSDNAIRKFRDTVLAKTPRGRDWANAYYRFSPEAIRIAMADPALAVTSIGLFTRFIGRVSTLTSGGTAELTADDLDEIDSYIVRVEKRAGSELRSALDRIRHDLRDPGVMAQFGIKLGDRPKPAQPAKRPGSLRTAGLRFEENRGQADRRFDYVARGTGYDIALGSTGMSLQSRPASFRMRIAGAARRPGSGEQRGAAVSNYLKGSVPEKWLTGVAQYGRVRYLDVYPGVDLVYYDSGGRLEHDFVLSPGAKPEQIALAFEGVDRVRITPQGDLALDTGSGQLRLEKPSVYQETANGRKAIDGRYRLHAGRVGFAIGPYDRHLPLVVDPVISYATYLGGSGADSALAIAAGADGSVYVTGTTLSTDFLTRNAAQPSAGRAGDVFVTRLNPAGQVVYSTYLGGSNADEGLGIAVDAAGNAYITGATRSSDFPVKNAYQSAPKGTAANAAHVFISKLDTSGALVYSTYLSGSGEEGARGIAVAGDGSVYIAGGTSSTDFPVVSALQTANKGGPDFHADGFVARLDSSGQKLLYATYLGGSADDLATALAIDPAGNAYVTGITYSRDFPQRLALQNGPGGGADAFVAKIGPTGSTLLFSTYLGGPGSDFGFGLTLDSLGSVYVTGLASAGFPRTNLFDMAPGPVGNSGADAFAAKIDATNSVLQYSTVIGSSGIDSGFGIAVDPQGNAYIAGATGSPNFASKGAPQERYGGLGDGFVAMIAPDGKTVDFRTYIGGGGMDAAMAIAALPNGDVVAAGLTGSTNGIATYQSMQSESGGNTDAWIGRFSAGTPVPSLTNVSAASFLETTGGAPNSIVSAFGTNLAARTDSAPGLPLPPTLSGVSVSVRDARGNSAVAPLFFVSAGQINFLVPAASAAGLAQVTVTQSNATVAVGTLQIRAVAPALFSADASGKGTPAAQLLTVAPDGSQSYVVLAAAKPIDLGTDAAQYLILYGTGVRGYQSKVMASVGGVDVPVLFAGAQSAFPGLDQVNIGPIPKKLAGSGAVPLQITVDGRAANPLTVAIR